MRILTLGIALAAVPLFYQAQSERATAADKPPLAFVPASTNAFSFNTGVLRGLLREGGRSKGLSSVIHIPTGTRLDRSMGLAGHYRVFTANKRYGNAAWEWPSLATLLGDGAVQVHWPATDDRPFDLSATYRWTAPTLLEVETTVAAKARLERFESFFASYFSEAFTNALVYVSDLPERPGAKGLMRADLRHGTWLAFPRDEAAWEWVRDGRWSLPPNPVDWVRMPLLAQPLGIRRAPEIGISALLMSPISDSFCVLTPQEREGHYSMYLSLFGKDLRAGETASAKAKLLVVPDLDEMQLLRAATNETLGR